MRRTLLALVISAAATLPGCGGAPRPATFTVEPANYPQAFDSARDVLRDYQFDLARVDARAGVIITQPTSSSGFATPWINHTDTLDDGVKGLMEFERRLVNVRFAPQGAPDAATGESPDVDVLAAPGPIQVDVKVLVERIYRPGRRPDATGVRLMSYAIDPEAVADGSQPWFVSQDRDDVRLAGRLAAAIERDMTAATSAKSTTPTAGLK